MDYGYWRVYGFYNRNHGGGSKILWVTEGYGFIRVWIERGSTVLQWLNLDLPVELVQSQSAGRIIRATTHIPPSTPLFTIPARFLLNSRTLASHYPQPSRLSAIQLISLHLSLYRPTQGPSQDELFGPYIDTLPVEFDLHPLVRPPTTELPPSVASALQELRDRYTQDLQAVRAYVQNHRETLLQKPGADLDFELNFPWAWLNQNTRCIYHRIKRTRADPDNLTMCPILDFANHRPKGPAMTPRISNAESADTSPITRLGDPLTLLSPPIWTNCGEELFLTYGAHSNRTLYVEYGFVVAADDARAEIDVQDLVEPLFLGDDGTRKRQILTDAGYWGDWKLDASPAISYRLITALRLVHASSEADLGLWEGTVRGTRENISGLNEAAWKADAFIATITLQAIIVLAMVAVTFRKVDLQVNFNESAYKTVPLYLALFALAEIFELFMAFDALRLRNTIQLMGILLFHMTLIVFSAIQVEETKSSLVTKTVEECAVTWDKTHCTGPGSLWNSVQPFLIIVPIIIAVAWLILMFWIKELYSEFGWAIFHVVGANPKMKKMYQWYQIMLCLLKFDFAFFIGVTIQLLILVLVRNTAEFGVTIAAIPVVLVLLVLCGVAVQREIKWIMTISLGMMLAAMSYLFKLVRIYEPSTRYLYDSARASLTVFTILAFLLLFATFAVGLRCFADFGRGLKASKINGKAAKAAKKATKVAQKTQKSTQKKAGKQKKQKPDSDSDDDQDLEAILEKLRVEWEEAHKVTEEVADGPPSRRANATLTPCPLGNHLWSIGGEFFTEDGRAYFYSDVYRYSPEKDEWRRFVAQTCPGPRSAHAVASTPAGGGKLFLFGGEFSSLHQNSFHRKISLAWLARSNPIITDYRDFWCFDIQTHSWDRIETKVKPSARSGHRMATWKHFIVLFGGFFEPSSSTMNSPRSGFSFISTPEGILLHGGYCKEYAKGKRPVGIMLEDTCMSLAPSDKPSNSPVVLKWERRKRPSTAYAPALRSGCTMTLWSAKQMGIMFGGVSDEDTHEETLESTFWNDLNGYQIAGKGRWVSLTLKRPKGKGKKKKAVVKDEDEEASEHEEEIDPDDPILTTPLPRFNAMLAVLRNTLYIYGGIYERGKREYTMDDFYSIQLDKLEKYTCLKKSEIVILNEDEESSEDDSGSDDGDGDEGEGDDSSGESSDDDALPGAVVEDPAEPETDEADLRAQATAFMGVAKDSERSPEDAMSTPIPGETLAVFYGRSKTYWAQKALESSELQERQPVKGGRQQGKQVRRDGFALAQERYNIYLPLLKEAEKNPGGSWFG
ncbi:SET domain-containing protein [Mycena kentingensis (nom. inval.)]|nr:SET domain-containing protein [Mycena kentingensis (nom. inval.)]